MHISHFIEAICAVHLSSYVQSPFEDRGGVMVVGPPGVLKSTVVDVLSTQYGSEVVQMSDINAQGLITLRDAIGAKRVRTLVLPELRKLYERHPTTALNVEGTIRAMAAEGFTNASFEDVRITQVRARATIVGALTQDTYRQNFARWDTSGFHRRFLWSHIILADANALEEAVVEWKRINFHFPIVPRAPLSGESIPNETTTEERRRLRQWLAAQPGGSHAIQLQIMTKMLAVLRWWAAESGHGRDPMETMRAFAESLGKQSAEIVLESPKARTRRKRRVSPRVAARTLARERWVPKRRRKK